MAKLFRYFEDWKTEVFTCPNCGWQGTFQEGDVEIHAELMDSSCPACPYKSAPMLAIVSWPTLEEYRENWDKVSEVDKAGVRLRERFLATFEEMSLKSADQLPDLEGEAILISWDYVSDEPDGYTTLSANGKAIWREPAVYEGRERFGEVVAILAEKYEERLKDVVPTRASHLYLYGDQLGAPRAVDKIRARIQGKQDK